MLSYAENYIDINIKKEYNYNGNAKMHMEENIMEIVTFFDNCLQVILSIGLIIGVITISAMLIGLVIWVLKK